MIRGQRVKVTQAFEEKAVMVVVDYSDRLVYVCRVSEYRKAGKENREAKSTGVPQEYVKAIEC